MTEKQEFSTYNVPSNLNTEQVYDTPLLVQRSSGEYTVMLRTGNEQEAELRKTFDAHNQPLDIADYLVEVQGRESAGVDENGAATYPTKWVYASTLTREVQEGLRENLGYAVIENEGVPASEEVQLHSKRVTRALGDAAVHSSTL